MKTVQIHNRYRVEGGENKMFDAICNCLRRHHHVVIPVVCSSREIGDTLGERIRGFFQGIYSFKMKRHISNILEREKPDLVHIHNLFPLISTSVLTACREHEVPVVLRCPNFRLTCPIGLHVFKGSDCTRCLGGREYWCFLQNCRENAGESLAFSVRSMVARKARIFETGVTLYEPPSNSVADHLVAAGYPRERMAVIPNMVEMPKILSKPEKGCYVAFAGRISPEKGLALLIAACRKANVPLRIAGDIPSQYKSDLGACGPMVQYTGFLTGDALSEFYRQARFAVVPSLWHEAFGLVAAEAMAIGLPVIASRIGGLQEVVDDGETGFLVEPRSVSDLTAKIERLWKDRALCLELGTRGRAKAIREYSGEVYYKRLMAAYELAVRIRH